MGGGNSYNWLNEISHIRAKRRRALTLKELEYLESGWYRGLRLVPAFSRFFNGGNMKEKLEEIKKELPERLKEITNISDLSNLKAEYFGKNGKVKELTKTLKELTNEETDEEDNIYKDVVNEVNKILDEVNLAVMECYKDLFQYKYFVKCTGGIIILFLIFIQCISIIIYFAFNFFWLFFLIFILCWSSIPGSGRSHREGNGNPLHYSFLGKPMDRGAWWATVHGVSKESDTI